MGIHSDAFGRVTLTNEDARKFEKQAIYGRPKKAATESLKRGSEAVKEYQAKGTVRLSVKVSSK